MLPINLITKATVSIQTTIGEVPTSKVGEEAEEEVDHPSHHAKFAAGVIT
jgi:hypothetical protein